MKIRFHRFGKAPRFQTKQRYFGVSDGYFYGGVYAPDDLNAHFHVGIIGKDGKVLFSTKADGPSMKDSIPDGHGYLLPVPVAWLSPNAAPAEVQFVVIETGEVFPKEVKSFPVERLRKSLGGYAESGESIKKSLSYATAEVLAMAERGDATVVLGTHELTRTGAPLILLEIARQVRQRYKKEIVLLCEGPSDVLRAEFEPLCKVIVTDIGVSLKVAKKETVSFCRALVNAARGSKALINSLSSTKLVLSCHDVGLPVISLVHEYPYAFPKEWIRQHFDASERVIFPCSDVMQAYARMDLANVWDERFLISPQGCYQLERAELNEASAREFEAQFRKDRGIGPDALLIVSCGTADTRKGIDWFAALISRYFEKNGRDADAHFVWVGKVGEPSVFFHVEHDLHALGLLERFHHLDELEDVRPALRMADVFLLCSRIDPFPSVVLESFAQGVPVIGFDRGQGCREMIQKTGFGKVVPYQNIEATINAINEITQARSDASRKVSEGGLNYVKSTFQFEDYVDGLMAQMGESKRAAPERIEETPKVKVMDVPVCADNIDITVCLPVYRRGEKLRSTLRSLQDQSYVNFVVLIGLEPASDNGETLSVCREFAAADPRFQILENPETLGWAGNIRSLMCKVTTPFFMTLPHDDALHKDCLQKLIDAAHENEEAVVIYPDIYFFGSVHGRQVVTARKEAADERITDYFLAGGDPEFWKGLTRRAMLKDGESFPVDGTRSFASEYEWALRLLARGAIHRVPTPLYYKLIHSAESDSVSTHWLHRLSETERLRELRSHHLRMRELAADVSDTPSVRVACDLAWLRRVLEFSGEQAEFLKEERALLEELSAKIPELEGGHRNKMTACVHVLRARQSSAVKDFTKEEEQLREALLLYPENREAKILLIKSLLRQSRTDEALTEFIAFHDALPESTPDWRTGEVMDWISSQLKHLLGK